MSEDQLSRQIRRHNNMRALLIALCLWGSSGILAGIIWLIILAIGKYISYPASALGQVSVSVLAVVGILVALLFAVFAAINGQSRENRYSGFQLFRRTTEDLENLNVRLKKQALKLVQRMAMGYSPYMNIGQQLNAIQDWVSDLNLLLGRLNSITMNWRGWNSDADLEGELLSHVHFAQSISQYLSDDADEVLMIFEQSMRSILIGLRRLDEAAITDILLLRLGAIMGSLITLVGFGLILHLGANLDIGFSYSSEVILFEAIFISMNVLLHLCALVFFITRWWDRVRERDARWAS